MKEVRRVEFIYELLQVVLGLVIVYVITLTLIVIASDTSSADIIKNFVVGLFTNNCRFGQLMGKFILYVLSGCSMYFVYGCGRSSLIGEGTTDLVPIVVYLALFHSGMFDGLSWIIGIVVLLTVCCVVGGILVLIPACGRKKYDTSGTVTSIIINYLLLFLSIWILKLFSAGRSQSFLCSSLYSDNARSFQLIPRTNLHAGVFASIIDWVIACLMFGKTRIGVKIRICGANGMLAKYSGINTRRTPYLAQLIDGVFAGAVARVDVFGMYTRYQYSVLANIGMDALIMATIVRKKPVFIPLAAFVLAYVRTSAAILNLSSDVPVGFVNVAQTILILFITTQSFLQKSKEKVISKLSYEEEEAKKGGSVA